MDVQNCEYINFKTCLAWKGSYCVEKSDEGPCKLLVSYPLIGKILCGTRLINDNDENFWSFRFMRPKITRHHSRKDTPMLLVCNTNLV